MAAQSDTARTPRGDVLVSAIEYARTPGRRMRGLLGRSALGAGNGLWIEPAPSVHTYFMRFAIDVVFLDRDRRVLRVAERIAPWRVVGARHARVALELPAGAASRAGLAVGDTLMVSRAEEASP